MAKRVTHSHEDGLPFRDGEAYEMAHRCKYCGAAPGVRCDNRNSDRNHQPRQDAGARHGRTDYGNAPWPEDRVTGECYSTLPGCG